MVKRALLLTLFIIFASFNFVYAQSWTQVNTDGFGGDVRNEEARLIVYKNMLYVSIDNWGGANQIWRTSAVGGPPFTDWEQVNTDGFGDGKNNSEANFAVYNNFLYVTVYNEVTGCEVWRTAGVGGPPFTDWEQVNTDGFGDGNNVGGIIGVYNNFLYVVTDKEVTGCEVWRTAGVGGPPFSDWEQVNTDGFGDTGNKWVKNPVVYNNCLYIAVENSAGAEIWRTAGVGGPPFTDWKQVNTNGFGDINNYVASLAVYNKVLYSATSNEVTGCEVWEYREYPTPAFKAMPWVPLLLLDD